MFAYGAAVPPGGQLQEHSTCYKLRLSLELRVGLFNSQESKFQIIIIVKFLAHKRSFHANRYLESGVGILDFFLVSQRLYHPVNSDSVVHLSCEHILWPNILFH